MTFYMGEPSWFIALAFVVVSLVIVHEIVTRRRNGRRDVSGTEERRSVDGQ